MPRQAENGTQQPVVTTSTPVAPAAVSTQPRQIQSRSLLSRGNDKLGSSISSFSLPHATDATCPGRTPTCTKLCYVSRYTRRFALSYEHNRVAAEHHGFVAKMVREARMVRVVRVHVAGDFYSEAYTRKWIQIARQTPHTLFYAYTRSWRGGGVKLLEALIELSKLPNFVLNISTDRDTGIPGWLIGAFGGWGKLVYMAVDDRDIPRSLDGQPEHVNIVFRVKRTTIMGKMAGSKVCPVENGIANDVNCELCRLCFKAKDNNGIAAVASSDYHRLADRAEQLGNSVVVPQAGELERLLQEQDAQREAEGELQRLEDLREYNATRL